MADALSIPAQGGPQSKTCTKCGETKPLSDFARSKRGLYGRRGDCSVCHRKVVKAVRDRRAREAGKPELGGPMVCAECGGECRRRNSNQKYCEPCAKIVEKRVFAAAGKRHMANNPNARERSRLAQERYRQGTWRKSEPTLEPGQNCPK